MRTPEPLCATLMCCPFGAAVALVSFLRTGSPEACSVRILRTLVLLRVTIMRCPCGAAVALVRHLRAGSPETCSIRMGKPVPSHWLMACPSAYVHIRGCMPDVKCAVALVQKRDNFECALQLLSGGICIFMFANGHCVCVQYC